jgi:hypothetical protein
MLESWVSDLGSLLFGGMACNAARSSEDNGGPADLTGEVLLH